MLVAIDTGGTFTDCVYLDGGTVRVLKLRSTPGNPAQAILACLRQIRSSEPFQLRHGTTVGTNAMLEGKGARVAFVTTSGFEDTIAIGRQTRPKLYDFFGDGPPCLVPPDLRFGLNERVTAEGEVLFEPTEADLGLLGSHIQASGAEAIALSLLFSFLRPENELKAETALRRLGIPVSTSHRILPEFREYERASTIVVNAYLTPKMKDYLSILERELLSQYPGSSIEVMQSSGGVLPAHTAAEQPVRTILSGPAGGLVATTHAAATAGFPRVVGLDMGGTSTDVFLVDGSDSGPQLISDAHIAGLPIGVPMLDIHTAGAGGGSIAVFDDGGLLHVGPESAGADPGPICFGKGDQPTVTDANLLLGRLAAEHFIGGTIAADQERARIRFDQLKRSLPSVEDFASGILRIVESHMQRAIRLVSVERGYDPRQFTLVAFGGGGPVHACALAKALEIRQVLIPTLPGALSAVGILQADSVWDFSCTVMLSQDAFSTLEEHFVELEKACSDEHSLHQAHIVERSVDIRYRGQGYELTVPHNSDALQAFHRKHEQRYGFSDPFRPVEIVNLRLRLTERSSKFTFVGKTPRDGYGAQASCGKQQTYFDGRWHSTTIYDRDLLHPGDTIHGPALIAEYTSTTVIPPGCRLIVDRWSNLLIQVN